MHSEGVSRLRCDSRKGRFVVNVLGEDQGALSDHFASPKLASEEPFDGYGFPKLEGCLGYLHCNVVDQSSQGTHKMLVKWITTSSARARRRAN